MTLALDIIPPHSTWDVIDASKLSEYMRCPRKYFFHYVLGWQRNSPNNHLVFGTAWHMAAEHLLLNNYTQKALEEASLLFLSRYRQEMDASTDEMMRPKDPLNALESLALYAKRFSQDVRDYETLHTEIGGVVMISPTAQMYFKIDWLGRERSTKKYLYIDHKTSQRRMSDWGSHWTLSTQMLLYRHVLHCLYPREALGASLVRCSFFYKSKPTEFEQHPIQRTPEQMQAWLVSTQRWYSALQYDMQLLGGARSDDVAMMAFPTNDNACFDFGIPCAYHGFCTSFANPLRLAERGVPMGFHQEYWDPRDQPTMKEYVDLSGEQHA